MLIAIWFTSILKLSLVSVSCLELNFTHGHWSSLLHIHFCSEHSEFSRVLKKGRNGKTTATENQMPQNINKTRIWHLLFCRCTLLRKSAINIFAFAIFCCVQCWKCKLRRISFFVSCSWINFLETSSKVSTWPSCFHISPWMSREILPMLGIRHSKGLITVLIH